MVDTVPLEHVAQRLALGPHEHVSIVGGGGKTTILHALAHQLSGSVVVTCTTKMGHDQERGLPVLLSPTDAQLSAADTIWPAMVWGRIDGHKAVGVTPEDCDRWFELVDHIVVEADGSRRRPFKAPAEYEPVVPQTTTIMVSVIGADALGRVIADQCHRPLRVAALAQCSAYERLTPEAAATVLLHPRGARKELPSGARLAIAVTKVETKTADFVGQLVEALQSQEPGIPVVAIDHDPAIAAVQPRTER